MADIVAGGNFLTVSPSPVPTGEGEGGKGLPICTPEDLSVDARLMGRTMDEFVRREVVPVASRLDAQEAGLMRSLVQEAGRLGLLGATMPRRYGGLDVNKSTAALLAEKSATDLAFAITISVHSGVATLPVLLFGNDEQRGRYLPGIATGETIAAFALSEGNSGSDALAAQTQARQIPGGYSLDGTKLWVTNGGFADLLTVFARAPEGFTAFLVPRDAPGLTLSGEEQKMGLRGSSTRRVFLNEITVEAGDIVGEVGKGHRPALYALNAGRFNIGAIALGGSKEALRIATKYAVTRRQAGHSIAEFGLIADKLAEMATRIFVLESIVYRTAGYWDASIAAEIGLTETLEEYAIECAIVKFFGTEVLDYAVDECLQIHGGFGYSEEFPAARLYRDARVFRIFEGTNEINRLTVVDQFRRRIERGRLTLAIDPMSTGHNAVDALRAATQFVVDKVLKSAASQQAAAAAADTVALLYALESATLRIERHPSALGHAIVDAFADRAITEATGHLRIALATIGVPYDEGKLVLQRLVDRSFVNSIALREAIAAQVRDAGGYPV